MADLAAIAAGLRVASTWVSGPRAAKLASYADELDAHTSTPAVERDPSGALGTPTQPQEGDSGNET